MTRMLTLAHLYPDEMSIYGDHGNVVALVQRARWRDIDLTVREVRVGAEIDLSNVDLVFGGGGQDRGQLVVADDLQRHAPALRQAAADGMPMLAVCGTYQLFGRVFITANDDQLPGIGIFETRTVASDQRLVGNIVVDSPELGRVVGFENHSGLTRLDPEQQPLGTVVTGHGNDGHSGDEGAVTHHVYGTYLHGPVLPKNPAFADALLGAALQRRYGERTRLAPLDDRLERRAASVADDRIGA